MSLFLLTILTLSSTALAAYTDLQWAASKNDVAKIRALLNQGANPNEADQNGETALIWAAQEGSLEAARLLVDGGAAVDQPGHAQNTALLVAAYKGHLPVVQFLHSKGADIEASNASGETPLARAVVMNRTEVVHWLLKQGVQVDRADRILKRTPLMEASFSGRPQLVKTLLAHQADWSLRDVDGRSALHLASQARSLETVELLLQAGADPDWQTHTGETAMDLVEGNLLTALLAASDQAELAIGPATGDGRLDVVKRLVETGKLETKYLQDSLDSACRKGHTEIVRFLLQHKVDPTASFGVAAAFGHLELVQLLHQAGAPIDTKDSNGQTPLFKAAVPGHLNVVRWLLENGADPKTKDAGGKSIEQAMLASHKHYEALISRRQAHRNYLPVADHQKNLAELRKRHAEILDLLN